MSRYQPSVPLRISLVLLAVVLLASQSVAAGTVLSLWLMLAGGLGIVVALLADVIRHRRQSGP